MCSRAILRFNCVKEFFNRALYTDTFWMDLFKECVYITNLHLNSPSLHLPHYYPFCYPLPHPSFS